MIGKEILFQNIWIWKKECFLKRRFKGLKKYDQKACSHTLYMSPLAANIILIFTQAKQGKQWLAGRAAGYLLSIPSIAFCFLNFRTLEIRLLNKYCCRERNWPADQGPGHHPAKKKSPVTKEAQNWTNKTWCLLCAFIQDTQFLHFRFITVLFLSLSIKNKKYHPSKQVLIKVFVPSSSTTNKNTALQKKVPASVPYRGEGDKKKRKIQ